MKVDFEPFMNKVSLLFNDANIIKSSFLVYINYFFCI